MTEKRSVDPVTGGAKNTKPEAFDLLPPDALLVLARVYGWGCGKYAPRNWERGYPWGWSYAACQRHLWKYWSGEDIDPESGLPHLAHAAWHCLTLLAFYLRQAGTDDRKIIGIGGEKNETNQ